MKEETRLIRKSKLRKEIEALHEQRGMIHESRISVVNLEDGETHYFEDYQEALAFLKGRKGRWYITSPGLRYSGGARPDLSIQ